MKIYLSASNQFDNLYNDGKHTEGDVCYMIAQKAMDYIGTNHIVKLGGRNASMMSKIAESNAFGADYHVCIHTNAGGGEGTEVFCWPGNQSDKYVKRVYEKVSEASPGNDRGIKTSKTLAEISRTNATCIYVECEFHDTRGDWIFNNVERLGYCIANAFVDFIDMPVMEPTTERSLYKVQCGAFTTRERAEYYKNELKIKYGLDCFIVQS